MIRILRDPYKISQGLAVLFVVAILISAYFLYSLPKDMLLSSDNSFLITRIYVLIALTFILGGLAIYMALKSKRELIVFRDKIIEDTHTDAENSNDKKSTISLEGVRKSLTGQGNERYTHFLQALCKQIDAGQGAFYIPVKENEINKIKFVSGYAFNIGESTSLEFEFGEGLIGQVATEQKTVYIDDIPEGYIKIISGLGSASPRYLLIAPVKDNENLLGVVEIASFKNLTEDEKKFIEEAIQILVKNQL